MREFGWLNPHQLSEDKKKAIRNLLQSKIKNRTQGSVSDIVNQFITRIERTLAWIEVGEEKTLVSSNETWAELEKKLSQVGKLLQRMNQDDAELFYFSNFENLKNTINTAQKDVGNKLESFKGLNRGNPANPASKKLIEALEPLWEEHIGQPHARGSFGQFAKDLLSILGMRPLGDTALQAICTSVG